MNSVQGVPAAQYMPFSAGSELPPLASGTPAAVGSWSPGAADGVADGSMQFGGAIGGQAPNLSPVSSSATDPNSQTTADPSQQSGGFFAVLQNLMDQLDTMIGQLLGTPQTPVSGGGTAGPLPGDGGVASPPDTGLIAAPAQREPL